jgi:hypothetical protein
MDFKEYVSGKPNQGPGQQQAGPNTGNMPNMGNANMGSMPNVGNIENQIRQVQGMSMDDMMGELRKAKQSGSLNDGSLRQLLDMMGSTLTEQQRRNILNLVNNL